MICAFRVPAHTKQPPLGGSVFWNLSIQAMVRWCVIALPTRTKSPDPPGRKCSVTVGGCSVGRCSRESSKTFENAFHMQLFGRPLNTLCYMCPVCASPFCPFCRHCVEVPKMPKLSGVAYQTPFRIIYRQGPRLPKIYIPPPHAPAQRGKSRKGENAEFLSKKNILEKNAPPKNLRAGAPAQAAKLRPGFGSF